MNKLQKIYSDIKEVRIQGAINIAKAAIKAYELSPTEKNKKILLSMRPTEPTLSNAMKKFEELGRKKILSHFSKTQKKINFLVSKIMKN